MFDFLTKLRPKFQRASDIPPPQKLDPADRHVLDNLTGLLNMHTAKNPYGFSTGEIEKVKAHRATMKIVAETYVHRIEKEGPSIETLKGLANVKNDLAEYKTAQMLIEQLLDIAAAQNTMPQDSIAFMMTDKCNLRCTHCFIFNEAVFHPVPRDQELKAGDYVTIFRSMMRTERHFNVHITGGGEVFARKDFEAIMKSLAGLGANYHISIQTNGHFPERLKSMLEDDDVRDFIDIIQFSLDGLEATHNNIRGNNNFEKLVASIKIARQYDKETSTITTVLNENMDELEAIREFSQSLGVANHRFQLFFEGAKLGLDSISKASDFITERDRSLVFNDATAPGDGCLAGIRTCIVRPNGVIETCRESYSGNVPRMVIADLRDHDLDLPAALGSADAIAAMRRVKHCTGCACFCAR